MADKLARTARVTMHMAGRTIGTVDLAPYLTAYTYVDVAHGEADSISATIDNSSGKFLKSKKPVKGTYVTSHIITKNFLEDAKKPKSLWTGKMMIDSFSASGATQETVTVDAMSKPSTRSFDSTQRTHTYKHKTLRQILNAIAVRAGLKLSYSGKRIKLTKIEQSSQTDSEFAVQLCEMYGFRLKIFNKKLVAYEAKKYRNRKTTVTLPKSAVGAGYDLSSELEGRYTGAINTYHDKKKKKDVKVKIGKAKIEKYKIHYVEAKAKRDLIIRKKPKASSDKLSRLAKGKEVRVVKDLKNGWLKVAFTRESKKKIANSSSSAIDALVSKERSQIGYHGLNSKYGAQPWCARFQSWSFRHSGNGSAISGVPNPAYSGSYAQYGKSHSRWHKSPQRGDLVIFSRNGEAFAHIGLVIKVISSSKVRTIEGNTHNPKTGRSYSVAVKTRAHTTDGLTITGYFRPKYKDTIKKVSETVYGYIYAGKDRHNASVKRVTKVKKRKVERILHVDTPGYNKADAKRIARAQVDLANESVTTLSVTIPGGYPGIIATANVKLGSDWGGLSGKWFVDKVEHSLAGSSAYTEQVTMHFVSKTTKAVHSSGKAASAASNKASKKKVKALFTAYCSSNSGDNGGHFAANGERLQSSRMTCAAPKSVPFNTYVVPIQASSKINGKSYRVNDRGGAIKIRNGVYHFDILMPSQAAADRFGVKHGHAYLIGMEHKGSKVHFKGGYAHSSSNGGKKNKYRAGEAEVTRVNPSGKYPYHIRYVKKKGKKKTTVHGWVKASQLR